MTNRRRDRDDRDDVVRRSLVERLAGADALTWIGIGVALLPLAVSAFALLGVSYHPTGDFALLELRTRDLGHEAVLLGPLSRDEWYHLGPTVYYLFYLPYHLAGESSPALLLTALLVNAACIAGMALIARRHGGAAFMVANLIGCALLIRSFGAEFMLTPWNPTITVFPLGLMVSLTWAMTCGSTWALPIGATVATFLVHTHVGYLGLAVPLLVFGLAWLVWSTCLSPSATSSPTARRTKRSLYRAAGVALAVLVVLWLPPIIEQLTNDPGNLEAVFDYLRSPPEDAHTLHDGLNVLSPQFALDPAWITGERALNRFNEPAALEQPRLPVLAVAVLAAFALLLKRGSPQAKRFVITIGLALALAVATIARTPGPLYMYRLDWMPLLGMMAALTVVWAAMTALSSGGIAARLRTPATWSAAVALVGLASMTSAAATGFDVPGHQLSHAVSELVPGVLADLPAGDGQVVFHRGPDFIAGSVARGLELNLERRGVRTAADGEGRIAKRPRAEYMIVADKFLTGALEDPRYEMIAVSGPLNLRRQKPGYHTVAALRIRAR